MRASGLPLLLLSWLLPGIAAAQSAAPAEPPDEIVVTGRQPGPPLWRVSNGDHVLWIFPQLAPVPKGMVWESNKVAAVIAQAQEALGMPDIGADFSPRVYLNPINLFRGARLEKRLSGTPSGQLVKGSVWPGCKGLPPRSRRPSRLKRWPLSRLGNQPWHLIWAPAP